MQLDSHKFAIYIRELPNKYVLKQNHCIPFDVTTQTSLNQKDTIYCKSEHCYP